MTDLPPGWAWATLADVADVQLGRQRSPKNHVGPHMRPYLRAANVTWSGLDLSDVKEMNFVPAEAAAFALMPGDILLNEASGSPNEVGKPAIWNGEIDGCCFQNTLLRVRTRGPVIRYLYWCLFHAASTGRFGEAGRGVNIRHLGKAGLAQFPIPLAPRAEQDRIVAAIEEHLSRLAAAEACLRSTLARLAILLQRVIDQNVRGGKVPLGTILCEPLRNGLSAKQTPDGDVRVLTLTAVTRGAFTEKNTKLISADHQRLHDLWLRPEDIFIQRSNTPELVGTARRYCGSESWAIFPDLLIRVRVSDMADSGYVELALRSSELRRYFQRSAQGIAGSMPKISQSTVERALIPLPQLPEQLAIVETLRVAQDGSAQIEAAVRKALLRARALHHSILSAAFSGRLVHQDPSDEPASVLLDRIRAERGSARPISRKKATT